MTQQQVGVECQQVVITWKSEVVHTCPNKWQAVFPSGVVEIQETQLFWWWCSGNLWKQLYATLVKITSVWTWKCGTRSLLVLCSTNADHILCCTLGKGHLFFGLLSFAQFLYLPNGKILSLLRNETFALYHSLCKWKYIYIPFSLLPACQSEVFSDED